MFCQLERTNIQHPIQSNPLSKPFSKYHSSFIQVWCLSKLALDMGCLQYQPTASSRMDQELPWTISSLQNGWNFVGKNFESLVFEINWSSRTYRDQSGIWNFVLPLEGHPSRSDEGAWRTERTWEIYAQTLLEITWLCWTSFWAYSKWNIYVVQQMRRKFDPIRASDAFYANCSIFRANCKCIEASWERVWLGGTTFKERCVWFRFNRKRCWTKCARIRSSDELFE